MQGGDASGSLQHRQARGRPAQQQRHALAGTDQPGDLVDARGSCYFRTRRGGKLAGLTAIPPGNVGRQDQRGDLPGRAAGGRNRIDRVATQFVGAGRTAYETGRDIARHGFDIGLQLGIQRLVIDRVITDDVDHRHLALARVMQIGQAIAQSAAQVQQRGRRLVGHARIAVGRTGGHTLEQGQHRTHARLAVEGGNEVHLAGAGVGETDLDAGIGQGPDQGLGTVGHGGFPQFSGQAILSCNRN